ncbi:MAG: FRG domain-containing protein [Bryobacteraceae bacterium]
MAKFDRAAFLKALNASPVSTLERLVTPGHSAIYAYAGRRSLRAIAEGMASAFSGGARIVELLSDQLRPGEGWQLLEPLLDGQTLILFHAGASTLPGRLAASWPRFVENPQRYMAPIGAGIVLDGSLELRTPGALVVLQSGSADALPGGFDVWPLSEIEAGAFEEAGSTYHRSVSTIGQPPVEAAEYEAAYRIYRRSVNHLMQSTADRNAAVALADSALRLRDERQVLYQAQANGLDAALRSIWDNVQVLRATSLPLTGGRHEDDPLPDVYAAALSMRIGGDWRCERERSLYRGQRNCSWRVIPTLYRSGSGTDHVEACMGRVRAFADALRSVYGGLSDDQCVAAAQHFGAEARTQTPLIDVSWDPFVALFFASDGAVEGDVGVIDHLVIPEWRKLVASSPHERGFIKVIEVDQVQRIARQRALFLATPDPEAYARYIPYRIWFKQHAGMAFHDEEYEQPISRQTLYPIDERMQAVLRQFAEEPVLVSSSAISAPETNVVFSAEYLVTAARGRIPGMDEWLPLHMIVLRTCAELFERGPEWSRDRTMFSLHRWDECVQIIEDAEKSGMRCSVAEALRWTLSRVDEESRHKILGEARSLWRRLHGPSDATVRERLAEILQMTRRTRMTGAVCFSGPETHVQNVLAALAHDERWTLLDLRGMRGAEIAAAIQEVQHSGVVVLATDEAADLHGPVRRLFGTARDGNVEVRPYLLTWGRSFERDSATQQLIDLWDDVDEFE